MQIVNRHILEEFVRRHPRSSSSLRRWLALVEDARWTNLMDVKALFPSADYVRGGRVVINIGGNNYRLIAVVNFLRQKVTVTNMLTHADYDRGGW